LEERNKASVNSSLRIEEAFPFEDTSYNAYPVQTYGAQAPAAQSPAGPAYPATNTPPLQPYGASIPLASRTRSGEEEAEAHRIQEKEQERLRMQQAQAEARGGAAPMKIKENYVPRAAQRAASKFGTQTAMCPNCKQQIPLNEMDEHMRSEFPRLRVFGTSLLTML
jgi:splicing factor 3A subunit 1